MELVIFLPFIFGLWLANYGLRQPGARLVTLTLLGLMNLLLLLTGSLVVLAGRLMTQTSFEMPPELPPIDIGSIGAALLFTGLGACIPLVPPVRRLLARLIPIDAGSVVHTTALVYGVYLVGNTVASWPIINALAEDQAQAEEFFGQFGLGDIWLSGLLFALMAAVGVGLFARRNWREVGERLKLGRLGVRQAVWAGAVLVALLVLEVGISYGWRLVDPASYERVGGLTDAFISPFLSPLGAITVGLSAGIGEELLFRGALQPRFGLLLTTLLFTLAHAQYSLSPALIGVFVVGFGLGLTRDRVNTTAAILVHAGFNFVQVILVTYLGT